MAGSIAEADSNDKVLVGFSFVAGRQAHDQVAVFRQKLGVEVFVQVDVVRERVR